MDGTGPSKNIKVIQSWFLIRHGNEECQKHDFADGASIIEPCPASKWSMKRKGEQISCSRQLKLGKRRCREENDMKVNATTNTDA